MSAIESVRTYLILSSIIVLHNDRPKNQEKKLVGGDLAYLGILLFIYLFIINFSSMLFDSLAPLSDVTFASKSGLVM
jgi:hypothetical protein